jgi:molybdate transport system substrate-binding protein
MISRSFVRRPVRRRGGVAPLVIGAASLVLAVVLAVLLVRSSSLSSSAGGKDGLLLYCAASNKGVIETIRKDYEAKYGLPLQIQYGPSQALLAAIEVTQHGDLFLPADDSYLEIAKQKQLVGDLFPLGKMQAVVVVPKGNPKGIKKLEDMLRVDVRVAQADADAAAIGKITREHLKNHDLWDQLEKHTRVFTTTVTEVANNVKVGAVDTGIVYDVVLHDYPDLEAVHIPELAGLQSQVTLAVLKTSRRAEKALELAKYIASAEGGLVHYRAYGFEIPGTAGGDSSSGLARPSAAPATTAGAVPVSPAAAAP